MRVNSDLNKHRKRNSYAIRKAAVNKKSGFLKPLLIGAAALLLLLSVFFSLNDSVFKIKGIPSIFELFQSAGLTPDVKVVEGDVSVHFIDVGQGDCQLIKSGSKNVLIDCGEKDYFSQVIQYLKAQKVKRLDYVIVTHPHSDHGGGMSYILDEFEIETVIIPKIKDELIPNTTAYMRFLKVISRKKINLEYAEPNKTYSLDKSELSILAPLKEYDDLNNYSIVAKLVHNDNSFLFTGDMEEEAEEDLLKSGTDISADVLKAAHHGSSSSTSEDFLEKVNPKYAVIEVGSPNDYGHPHKSVINRLNDIGAAVYRTDYNGNIVFVSNGKSFEIITEREQENADY